MVWKCDEVYGEETIKIAQAGCNPSDGVNPRVLICGDTNNPERRGVQCYNNESSYQNARFVANRDQKIIPKQSQQPLFSFAQPQRSIYDTSMARQNLFDQFKSYQPSHNTMLSPNFDLFKTVKHDMFDDLYRGLSGSHSMNINPRDKVGNTPLIKAILDNNDKSAAFLIVKGANVNISNSSGLTPLMAAASNNNELMVDILLRKGARKGAQTNNGMTADDFATDTDIKILLSKSRSSRSSKSKSSRSKSRSSRKACKKGQSRSRETGRCRKKK